MRRVKVPIYGAPQKFAIIDLDASGSAVLGQNIYFNGVLLDPRDVLNQYAGGSTTIIGGGGGSRPPRGDLTTDDVYEGGRLYFTAARAVAAVGAAVVDSANVTLTFAAGTIKADLTETGVTAGTYGDATHIAKVTVDAFGRVTAIEEVAGGGGIMDAPSDTYLYGRKDGDWARVPVIVFNTDYFHLTYASDGATEAVDAQPTLDAANAYTDAAVAGIGGASIATIRRIGALRGF